MPTSKSNLDLAVVGNSRIGALIDSNASVIWMCVPRFNGDPAFCSLLDSGSQGVGSIGQVPNAHGTHSAVFRERLRRYSMVGIIMCAKRLSRSWDVAF